MMSCGRDNILKLSFKRSASDIPALLRRIRKLCRSKSFVNILAFIGEKSAAFIICND